MFVERFLRPFVFLFAVVALRLALVQSKDRHGDPTEDAVAFGGGRVFF